MSKRKQPTSPKQEAQPEWWVYVHWQDEPSGAAEAKARGTFERLKMILRPDNNHTLPATIELRHGPLLIDSHEVSQ
jgi:hypothetical protein